MTPLRFSAPLAVLLLAALAASLAPRGVRAAETQVFVDGERIAFTDGKPQSVAGRTLVPMRAIFEALGANVEWNKELRKITARKDTTVIELTIDEKIGRKNGAEITMDVAPVIRAKSTLVPLRFVAEALDAKVDFDKAANTIKIGTEAKGDGGGDLGSTGGGGR